MAQNAYLDEHGVERPAYYRSPFNEPRAAVNSAFRLLIGTHDAPPWGVRVDELTKSRTSPTPGFAYRSFMITNL